MRNWLKRKRGWRILMDRCTRRWFYVRWPARRCEMSLSELHSIKGAPQEWRTKAAAIEHAKKVFRLSNVIWISTSEPSVILESPNGEREKIWLLTDELEISRARGYRYSSLVG